MSSDDKTELNTGTADKKFRKKEHLLKSKEFRAVYKKGRSSKKENVVLYAMPNTFAHCRIGFSISSRNLKRASRRNKMRRLFKEAYRLNKSKFTGHQDIVIVVRRDQQIAPSYAKVERLLLGLLKEAGVIR